MNLPKAIELGEHKVRQDVFQVDPDALTALKLLIEAGKRLNFARSYGDPHTLQLLPGED